MSNNQIIELNKIYKSVDFCEKYLYKNYLKNVTDLDIVKTNKEQSNIRILKLKKFIYNEKENNIEKLTSVLASINNINSTFAYIINSKKNEVEIYLAIKMPKNESDTSLGKDILFNGLKGNFPGIELENVYEDEKIDLIDKELFSDDKKYVSSSVVIPRLKEEKADINIQGIEKFIDSTIGQEYTAIFLAKSIKIEQIENIKNELENIHTLISPFKEASFTFGENESENISHTLSESITNGITNAISNTQGKTKTDSFSINIRGCSGGYSESIQETESISESKNNSESNTKGYTEGYTKGTNKSKTFKIENKNIIELLKNIDIILKRVDESKDVGMFSFGTYFLSQTKDVAIRLASIYTGLVKGNKSGIEMNCIINWDKDKSKEIKEELKEFKHPLFKEEINIEATKLITSRELSIGTGFPYKSIPGINISSFVPFARNVSSYNEYSNKNRKISLGKIFHMGNIEDRNVDLNIDDLTMHTFVTGSTGSGKSNTIYRLLDELDKSGIKFLIIEPAKGEYKNIFGGKENVNVFGTNPKYTDILKINPFIFHKDIHILEHIDRLIDIFNACWPMYAAMPALLKEAIELSYQVCGWDLENSRCISSRTIYPTFENLLDSLNKVIKNSGYSDELKSNYTGALCTRIKSLTNGLLRNIFAHDEIDNKVLFDENTIIDLSRMGSTETKSLITGILFIKLQEYRMINSIEINSELKHITVLEEAHNLLKNTSTLQSQEGANLQGKSVEMISNSIAEMRTYGEGFIIVDQAPNLLDDSVIRNTNTKIVHRLPQYEDRKSVGKSASLNDEQIEEIPKLKTGVAVVYQNNWLEPVLCKVEKFESKYTFKYNVDIDHQLEIDRKIKGNLFKVLLSELIGDNVGINNIDINEIREWLNKKGIPCDIKLLVENRFKNIKQYNNQNEFFELCKIIDYFVDKNKMYLYASKDSATIKVWTDNSIEYVKYNMDLGNNSKFERAIIECLFFMLVKENTNLKEYYNDWIKEYGVLRR